MSDTDIELIQSESTPTMMIVSPFSNITNRLKHFASGLIDDTNASNTLIHINCFTKKHDDFIVKVIRFTDDNGMWTEIYPHDRINGDILDRGISVNMYDLYNVIENCHDELITFWIDEDDNQLVLNSFYNETKSIDELEVRFAIKGNGASSVITDNQSKPTAQITLNAITYHTIMRELNVERSIDGVNIIIDDGKLKFQTNYNGFISELSIKEHDTEVYDTDVSVYIPINIFQLMISTGHVYDLIFNVYDNNILMLSTADYEFYYHIPESRSVYKFDLTEVKPYLIIDADLIESTLKLINRLNKQSHISTLTIAKVSDGEADLICGIDDRYSISIRTDLVILSNEIINVDSDILQEMVTRSNSDALALKYISPTKLYMKVENQLIVKEMIYDHEQFSNFRSDKYIEWKRKNA